MTEEQLTKAIIHWLKKKNWEVVCFDFPQSGTGMVLHPNSNLENNSEKNKGSIIPDIVAVKAGISVIFENKRRFVLSDFVKVNGMKINNNYSESISKLLNSYDVSKIFYGIGLPHIKGYMKKVDQHIFMVDFVFMMDNNSQTIILGDNAYVFE